MIISRSHLLLEKAVDDDGLLQINPDGSTFGSNKKVFILLGPVEEELRERLSILLDTPLGNPVSITPESAREIIKNVPKDKKFDGMLEHVNIEEKDETEVKVFTTDGKRSRDLVFKQRERTANTDIIGKRIEESLTREDAVKVCLNRKRLLKLLEVFDKATEDTSGEAPLWLSFTPEGDVALRGWDYKYGRPILGYMNAYKGDDAQEPPRTDWEYRFKPKSSNLNKRSNKRLLKRRIG